MAKNDTPDNKEDKDNKDDRDPFAIGYAKAMEVMAACIAGAVPILLGALAGYWLKDYCGLFVSYGVFFPIGLVFGIYVGFTQLMKVVK